MQAFLFILLGYAGLAFTKDEPEKCSGLPVMRCQPESLHAVLSL